MLNSATVQFAAWKSSSTDLRTRAIQWTNFKDLRRRLYLLKLYVADSIEDYIHYYDMHVSYDESVYDARQMTSSCMKSLQLT